MEQFKSLSVENAIEFGPKKVLCGLLKKSNRKLPCKNIDTTEDLKNFLSEKE